MDFFNKTSRVVKYSTAVKVDGDRHAQKVGLVRGHDKPRRSWEWLAMDPFQIRITPFQMRDVVISNPKCGHSYLQLATSNF